MQIQELKELEELRLFLINQISNNSKILADYQKNSGINLEELTTKLNTFSNLYKNLINP